MTSTTGGPSLPIALGIDVFGGLDIVVANAGVIRPGPDYPEQRLRKIGTSHWRSTPQALSTASGRRSGDDGEGGGSIITTRDIATNLIHSYNGAYRSAKATIAVTTLHAAEKLREFNINVNSVMPGATATHMLDTYFDSSGDDLDAFPFQGQPAQEKIGREAAPGAPETIPPLGVYLCTPCSVHADPTGPSPSAPMNRALFEPHTMIRWTFT